MTIEEALEIINNTNFYSCFMNEKQEEAFNMATKALVLFHGYKKETEVLERIKGDFVAEVIANYYRADIEKLEGSGENEKKS